MTETQALLEVIEQTVDDMLAAFDIQQPPVPIELMLQRPREGLWPRADLKQMTGSFFSLTDPYMSRISAARLLARCVARSDWGQGRGLEPTLQSDAAMNLFARAIIMPHRLLEGQLDDMDMLITRFEVPEEDVLARLRDLGMG